MGKYFEDISKMCSNSIPRHRQGFAKAMLNAITLNSLLHSLDSGVQTLPQDFSARYFKTNASRTGGLW